VDSENEPLARVDAKKIVNLDHFSSLTGNDKNAEVKRMHSAVLSELIFVKCVPFRNAFETPNHHSHAKIHIRSNTASLKVVCVTLSNSSSCCYEPRELLKV
ncbi:hypothetical protein CEXT_500201, partial [Caerostris extrusa]